MKPAAFAAHTKAGRAWLKAHKTPAQVARHMRAYNDAVLLAKFDKTVQLPPELQNRLRQKVKAAVAAIAGAGVERSRLTTWDVGELPRTVEREAGGRTVSGFPALVDEGDGAAVRVLPTAAEQAARTGESTLELTVLEALGKGELCVSGTLAEPPQVEFRLALRRPPATRGHVSSPPSTRAGRQRRAVWSSKTSTNPRSRYVLSKGDRAPMSIHSTCLARQ